MNELPQDKLDAIFQMQQAFDTEVIDKWNLHDKPEQEWVQGKIMAIFAELAEVLEHSNYRWWKQPRPLDREEVAEEMVDVLHFYISLCLTLGIDAEQLYAAYLSKNKENFARQAGLSEKPGYVAHPTDGPEG